MAIRGRGKHPKRRLMPGFSSSGRREMPAFYARMFMEDVYSGIMGYRLHEDREERRSIKIVGEEEAATRVEVLCASLARGAMYSVSRTIESAIESIALHLAWYGKTLYEICYAEGQEVALEIVPPYHLFRVPTAFVQVVPSADRRWLEGRRFAVLRSSQAWLVEMPKRLGGAHGYRKILKRLNSLSDTSPEFWRRDLEAGKLDSDFSFTEYRRAQTAAVARITRMWGWNRRDTSSSLDTEFFYYYRSLQFRRAQAVLRDHIVAEFNRLLSRLGIQARIELEGYPTPAMIERLIEDASSGTLNYVEAFKQSG